MPRRSALLYLITSFGFFIAGGLIALPMQAQLARPGLQFLSLAQYNQSFIMDSTIMPLPFATPIFLAFENYIVSLQIGAPAVALPRLNTHSVSRGLLPSPVASQAWDDQRLASEYSRNELLKGRSHDRSDDRRFREQETHCDRWQQRHGPPSR
jgi:hypothetical protein